VIEAARPFHLPRLKTAEWPLKRHPLVHSGGTAPVLHRTSLLSLLRGPEFFNATTRAESTSIPLRRDRTFREFQVASWKAIRLLNRL
jgi:hypothetical protein